MPGQRVRVPGRPGDAATALANERVAIKPHSPIDNRFLGRAAALDAPMAVAAE